MQAKKATIHLQDISADQAIEYILRTNGLSYEKKDKVILISTLPQDLAGSAYKGKVEVIRLKYISAEKAKNLLAKIEPSLLMETGERANSLVLKGKDSEIVEAIGLISEIDRIAPQILIESKVMEISQSDSVKLGISYGNGTYRFQTSKDSKRTLAAEDLVSSLNALIAQGSARVLANPKIATLDNQEALINIGNRIPFAVPVAGGSSGVQWSVQYIDAGVKLKIIPQLGSEGYITTFFQPEVSSISEWRTTAAGEFPVIATRNAAATVRVKNGETIVIGGLLSESDRENITKVPLLGYLPGIGLFFQNSNREKAKTEIVFMITPYIL
jgi:type II secretory pathway component GspD/PulD (secretin)